MNVVYYTTSPRHPCTNAVFDSIDLDLKLPDAPTDKTPPPSSLRADARIIEMDTKLDLALAYQEIGDHEGARELIDEVIQGGVAEQIEKAKALKQKLA